MDEADRAAIAQERLLEIQLAAAIKAARSIPGQRITAAEWCIECGEAISPDRRSIIPHTQYCTDCANSLESLRARGLI
jgi:RNA polymerase-binding transcription factor DksA